MKQVIILSTAALLLVSSCGSYAGSGAYAGATFGSILGSAIGGIGGGPRGNDLGTIIGMAGGAVIGGAIGNAQDQKRQKDLEQYRIDKAERMAIRQQNQSSARSYSQQESTGDYGSGFDETNSGDDRIYDFGSSDYTDHEKGKQPVTVMPSSASVEELAEGLTYSPVIEIRNARFVDTNGDNILSRGELGKVIFEVYNRGDQPLFDIQPTVVEATGNRHIFISPGMHVERLAPGRGIRYTAMVKADEKLKDGSIKICVSVIQGNNSKISKVNEFNIPTRK